jgi:hypothetical protein
MAGSANYAVAAGVQRFNVEAANQTAAMRTAEACSQTQDGVTI